MSPASFLLGLDISKSRTGAAYGLPGETPRFCSIVGRDLDNVRAAGKLGRWLIDFTREHAVAAIYFEAQLSPASFVGEWNPECGKVEMTSSPEATIALAKMAGVVEFVAYLRSIPAHPLAVATIRASFLGHGRPEHPKERAMALCRILGWRPENYDEADAAAVWYVGATREAPQLARVVTPMGQAKAATMTAGLGLAVKKPRREPPTRVDARGVEHISAADARGLFARARK